MGLSGYTREQIQVFWFAFQGLPSQSTEERRDLLLASPGVVADELLR